MMSFKRQRDHVIDMHRIAQEIGEEVDEITGRGPDEYAPPALRDRMAENVAVQQVTSFGALPTRELDELVSAAEDEIVALKREAQVVRDLYVKHTSRIAADIKRLQEGVKLSMRTMEKLREQCSQLDEQADKPAAQETHGAQGETGDALNGDKVTFSAATDPDGPATASAPGVHYVGKKKKEDRETAAD